MSLLRSIGIERKGDHYIVYKSWGILPVDTLWNAIKLALLP